MTRHLFSLILAIGFVWLTCGCESRNSSERQNESVARTSLARPDSDEVQSNRLELLSQVTKRQEAGDVNGAIEILRKLLVNDSQDFESVFILANLQASQGKLDEAIELLGDIPPEHPEAGIPSLGASADWCMERERYDDAEQRYLKILEIAPTFNIARRKLAQLLNREGRRHEANVLIRELCLAGDVSQDELHALIVEADAMYDEPGTSSQSGNVTYTPIGKMGQARFLYTNHRYLDAANEVEHLVKSGEAIPAVIAFYGCAVAEAQDDAKFALWLGNINQEVKQFPEYWAAFGTHLLAEGKYKEGVRVLAEAIRRDPTDHRSIRRIVQAFRSLQDREFTDRFIERFESLLRSVKTSVDIVDRNSSSSADFEKLAGELTGLNRRLEAILWRSVGMIYHAATPGANAQLNAEMRMVLKNSTAFPSAEENLCGLAIQKYPMPEMSSVVTNARSAPAGPSTLFLAPPATFLNASNSVDLEHQYKISSQPRDRGFSIYQSFGGGVAVLDYDQDGFCDFYFAQGASDPPAFVATESDIFYRTLRNAIGMKLSNATEAAGAVEARYTIGVTAGDLNQDGFPDIATSGIGGNLLLINNGDGTFKPSVINVASPSKLSSSLAIADVNGDHLPDVFVLNYVDDTEMTRSPEIDKQGNVLKAISPFSFLPALDDLWINDGWCSDGQVNWTQSNVSNLVKDASTGLGTVVSNFDESVGNELFVGNDERANQLWVRDKSAGTWLEQAVPLGCAFGGNGAPTGSMGIATADFDCSGSQDIHIANYYNEPVSLYMSSLGMFRDKCVKYELSEISKSVLGFGTQAIDYSNDGWPDLAVVNGHVEDLEWKGEPFRQPMQLFANVVNRFQLVTVEDSSAFWGSPHLGRALARLDFDRDGKADLVATDLLGPSALLLNQTVTDNHFVGIRLIGTSSERDAIGAKVQVEAGEQTQTAWVNAGDGYLCKNDPVLIFGIGKQESIDQVVVSWPNGSKQVYTNISVDRFVLITENELMPFEFLPITPDH